MSETLEKVISSASGAGKAHTGAAAVAAQPKDALSGHMNHLSEAQSQALVEFKQVCEKEGLYTPATAQGLASHDDATLLRFLRARKFEVQPALQQFKDTEVWRKENNIKELYEKFEIESYEEARKVYPQWTGHRDRRGHPVYIYVIRDLNSKNMAAYDKNLKSSITAPTHNKSKIRPHLLRLFALYENMTNFVMPLCTALPRPNPETPISSTTNIVDITGVGLKQFWNLKSHMQDASTLATAHYPETLDRIFIIGAPYFFPTVWGWIKRWFDPVTTSKIFILSASEVTPTLSSFIDPAGIPTQYGGQLDWQWGSFPNLDSEARNTLADFGGEKGWTEGPVIFDVDKKETVAVGSTAGKERHEIFKANISPEAINPISTTVPAPETKEEPQETVVTSSAASTTADHSDSTDATAPVVQSEVPNVGDLSLKEKEVVQGAAAAEGRTALGV